MTQISATEASRNFSELLDRVENRGERYTIIRRGRVVAQVIPPTPFTGVELKVLLRQHHIDKDWAHELAELRIASVDEGREWD